VGSTVRGSGGRDGGGGGKGLGEHRAGIKRVLLPEKNKKDRIDVPESVRTALEFSFATHVDDALKFALERTPFTGAPATPPVEEPKAEVRA